MTNYYCKELIIKNKLGLHARAATKLVQLVQQFSATITIQQGENQANANSVMGLLLLESSLGKSVTVIAEGNDAQAALSAIEELIDNKFDEKE